MESQQIELEVK
jgi:4-hydroxy-L-threonine phosphate dehydrogenase PdxA